MFQYKKISKTSGDVVSLETVKEFLRIDSNADDTIISIHIAAAVAFAEKYMGIDLLNATYEAYFDDVYSSGHNLGIVLRRAPFYSLESVEVDTGTEYEAFSDYNLRNGTLFGELSDFNDRATDFERIKVTFVAGYGEDNSDIPADITIGLLQHIAFMYYNRGDCPSVYKDVPESVTAVYDNYRVIDVFVG